MFILCVILIHGVTRECHTNENTYRSYLRKCIIKYFVICILAKKKGLNLLLGFSVNEKERKLPDKNVPY